MSTSVTPRLGRTVLYTLSESDAREIRSKRLAAGSAVHHGNDAHEGDTYPAVIVRDWAASPEQQEVNARAFAHGQEDVTAAMREDVYIGALAGQQVNAAQATVNLQVFLDGNDCYHATSRSEFDEAKHGRWVQVVNGEDHALPREMLPSDFQKESEGVVFRPDRKGHWTGEPVAW